MPHDDQLKKKPKRGDTKKGLQSAQSPPVQSPSTQSLPVVQDTIPEENEDEDVEEAEAEDEDEDFGKNKDKDKSKDKDTSAPYVDKKEMKMPVAFQRAARLGSFRVYQQPLSQSQSQSQDPASGLKLSVWRDHRKSLSTYSDYMHMVTHAMLTTKAKEVRMCGKSCAGSFLALSPHEHREFKKDMTSKLLSGHKATPFKDQVFGIIPGLRLTEDMADKKLGQRGGGLQFKGKGLPKTHPMAAAMKTMGQASTGQDQGPASPAPEAQAESDAPPEPAEEKDNA